MKKNESTSPLWPKTGVLDQHPGGGEGKGVLSFFFFIRSHTYIISVRGREATNENFW